MKSFEKDRLRAFWISLVSSVGFSVLKFFAYYQTGSQAVFSDAVESIVNILTALVALVMGWIALKPADQDHPYGHGKVEYFSATFEGGLVIFAGCVIIWNALESFFQKRILFHLDIGMVLMLITALGNFLLGRYLKQVGRYAHSEALFASGVHVLSDVWTTVGAILAIGVVWMTGWTWADPFAAMCLGLLLIWNGVKVIQRSAGGLLDGEDQTLLVKLRDLFEKHRFKGMIRVHYTRILRAGPFHHIDAHLVVPEFWNIEEGHNRANEFEHAVLETYSVRGEIVFHLDPCRRAYCRVCDYEPCPVRKESFQKREPFQLKELVAVEEPSEFGGDFLKKAKTARKKKDL